MEKQPQLYMVFASYGRSNGWAVFRAEGKTQARKYARTNGWLDNGRVDRVQTLRQYYDDGMDVELKDLRKWKKLKVGEYIEIDWGT